MDTYDKLREQMDRTIGDLLILCGDDAAPQCDQCWQNVAGTASANLRAYAGMLDSLREGKSSHNGIRWDGPRVFPSPTECADGFAVEAESAERMGEFQD
jgi:hypothetical protein